MKCVQCNLRTEVYDSRFSPEGLFRRKRKCLTCGYRFATLEVLDENNPPPKERVPKPKVVKPKRQPKVRLPKEPRVKSVKPRDPDDEFYTPTLDDDVWDVARELGIERYR